MPKEVKVKQTRKRIPRTCAQCRKRKQKCDSLKPCAVCKLRGEGDVCDYEGAQPTRILDEDDLSATPISASELQRLRSQLDGLEALVSQVVYKNANASSPGRNIIPEGEAVPIDLEAHDWAGQLQQMMTTRTLIAGIGPEAPVIRKVRRYCKEVATRQPEWTEGYYNPLGFAGAAAASRHFAASIGQDAVSIQALLPNPAQANLLLNVYLSEFEWYHACFPRKRFRSSMENFYNSRLMGIGGGGLKELAQGEEEDVDSQESQWIVIATLFAVARSAIIKVPDQQAKACGLPVEMWKRNRRSEEWLAASLNCLTRSHYESKHRLDSVVCLIVLLEAMWFDGPIGGLEDLNLLFDLKCRALTLGFDLGLHRDPAHRDPGSISSTIDPELCHHRRMLWWALLSLDSLISGPAGRVSSLISLDGVDVYLPALSAAPAQDTETHEGCEKGCSVSAPVAGVKPRLLLGFVGHEIARLPLRRTPPTTMKDLSKAHRDLTSLEAHLPPSHKLVENGHKIDQTQLPACSRARRDAFVFYFRYYDLLLKLHRPLHLTKPETNPPFEPVQNRMVIVHHALMLLDLSRVMRTTPSFVMGGVVALTAAISLALDVLFMPHSEEAPLIQQELDALVVFLDPATSPVIRRGLCVLECLMQTFGTLPEEGDSWFSTELIPVSATSWSHGPFHQPPDGSSFNFSAYDANGSPPLAQPVFQSVAGEFQQSGSISGQLAVPTSTPWQNAGFPTFTGSTNNIADRVSLGGHPASPLALNLHPVTQHTTNSGGRSDSHSSHSTPFPLTTTQPHYMSHALTHELPSVGSTSNMTVAHQVAHGHSAIRPPYPTNDWTFPPPNKA